MYTVVQKSWTTPHFFMFCFHGSRFSCNVFKMVFSNSFPDFLKVFFLSFLFSWKVSCIFSNFQKKNTNNDTVRQKINIILSKYYYIFSPTGWFPKSIGNNLDTGPERYSWPFSSSIYSSPNTPKEGNAKLHKN